MNKSIAAVLFAAVATLGASAAFADDSMSSSMSSSMNKMTPAQMAKAPTMVCRPAATGEKPNATLPDKSGIVCMKIDAAKLMKGPGMMSSADTENEAWVKMMQNYTVIPGFGNF